MNSESFEKLSEFLLCTPGNSQPELCTTTNPVTCNQHHYILHTTPLPIQPLYQQGTSV